ncbi:hypothetical protein BKE30_05620 [Alkanindiges hydrocarboniclasticus]|jgi:uncharacterized membrane protein YsdA (DUF1294 family)/cold shock CspA family protein|uniref:CSD domain-containing protein n=1 Tax=Alkanindiges hydrocarboniclasticus TaxID=1907941 RepID=A0A1S8CVB9_9GAMM|nr:DUF1294 domain-containing protein [Alkanindiges hydrocarboniclasticus]ONG41257.1 hypothetical protein BKE30_05620 [Alkanindiges hydrocarboniclasticus]
MRYQGQLIEWHDDQGYGFIQPVAPNQGNKKIFLHIKAFAQRGPRPLAGVMLEYEITRDGHGRLNAQRVTYVRRQNKSKSTDKTASGSLSKSLLPYRQYPQQWRGWLITLYLAFIVALGLTRQLPLWFLIIPVLLSGLSYWLYAIDKQAAQQGRRRIPEKNLHVLALLGGWPGALLAQQKLRHKSAKTEFQRLFFATVALNWVLTGLLTLQVIQQFFALF